MGRLGEGGGEDGTGDDPHAANAPLAADAILQHASRGGLDETPVRIDAGSGDLAGCVGVEEEGDACGSCSHPFRQQIAFWSSPQSRSGSLE